MHNEKKIIKEIKYTIIFVLIFFLTLAVIYGWNDIYNPI